MKNIWNSIKNNAVYDILKKICICVSSSGLSYLASFNVLKLSKLPLWQIVVLSVSVAAVITYIALCLYTKFSERFVPATRVESDYDVLEKM